MRGVMLQIVKCGLHQPHHLRAGLTPVLPTPRRRKLDIGDAAKIREADARELSEALHDRFIKSLSVMSVGEKWTNCFHAFSSLACTQLIWLTQCQHYFYNNCVRAISQDSKQRE